MKLTLVTACLNSETTLADTIDSVLSQTYDNIEYIICDGGSTDGTLQIIQSYGDRLTLLDGGDNGIFDAFNKGIRAAKGDIVGIINSDDFYSDKYVIEKVMAEFHDTSLDSVYGDLQYVQRDDINKIYRNWQSGEFKHWKFRYGWTIPHPTFFVRRTVYEKYGLFDPDFRISGDYEFELRVLYKHQISCKYIPEVLVKMRNHGNSGGTLENRFMAQKEDRKAWLINGLKPHFYTIPLKPIRKIFQYISPKFSRSKGQKVIGSKAVSVPRLKTSSQ